MILIREITTNPESSPDITARLERTLVRRSRGAPLQFSGGHYEPSPSGSAQALNASPEKIPLGIHQEFGGRGPYQYTPHRGIFRPWPFDFRVTDDLGSEPRAGYLAMKAFLKHRMSLRRGEKQAAALK